LKSQAAPFLQQINPDGNFSLTKNWFYLLINDLCEAFHGSEFAGLKIIRFLPVFPPNPTPCYTLKYRFGCA
jgi:hypothetical protein